MKGKPSRLLAMSVSLGVLGCSRGSTTHPLEAIRLRQEWTAGANYAGALMAAREFAPRHDLALTIVPGSEQVDPIRQVIAGKDQIADVGADKVIDAVSKGADLIVVGVLNPSSPACFLSRQELGIHTPKDFEGHRIGILTGTATEYIYRALIRRNHVDQRKLTEFEVPFDLTTFVAGKYDVRPAFIYDEPVALDLQGISYDVVEPRQFGVSFIGTVYVCKREFATAHRPLVQAFVDSVADGWTAAIEYPERAIKYLKEYDRTVDEKRELLALKKGLDYFRGKGGRVLRADRSDWDGMLAALSDAGIVREISLDRIVDNSFLESYGRRLDEKGHR